ncbi:hypothetical protein ANAEL_04065 [Anaerolineales bacterium]|nr:hypothetical protein ANAEL_04065 [Anaerolineales bacterium]
MLEQILWANDQRATTPGLYRQSASLLKEHYPNEMAHSQVE